MKTVELDKPYRWDQLPEEIRLKLIKEWSDFFTIEEFPKRIWQLTNSDPGRWRRKDKTWTKDFDPKYNVWSCSAKAKFKIQ